jgi:hypothetical protein
VRPKASQILLLPGAPSVGQQSRRQTPTVKSAFEEYLRRKASKLKSGFGTKREMRRDFKDWMDRPLADISPSLVKKAIQAIVDRGAPTNAHFLLAVTPGFFD